MFIEFYHCMLWSIRFQRLDELYHNFNRCTDLKVEERAVNNLNKILFAGYICHITNYHRFRVGETKNLHFRFDDALLKADEEQSQQGGNPSFEHTIVNKISNLTLNIHM